MRLMVHSGNIFCITSRAVDKDMRGFCTTFLAELTKSPHFNEVTYLKCDWTTVVPEGLL